MRKKVRFFELFFFLFSLFCCINNSYAQGVAITYVDPGPYAPGSSIAVRIALDPSVCLDQSNIFQLQLSDALGVFGSAPTIIGSNTGVGSNGSYATFINGTLPSPLAPGSNYRLRVLTTANGIFGPVSSPISVFIGAPVNAGVISNKTLTTTPQTVFGNCSGQSPVDFNFQNSSTNAATTTAVFYDDLNGGAGSAPLTVPGNFHVTDFTNYTVFVKAEVGLTVATKAYVLVNNTANNGLSNTSAGVLCLPTTGGATVSYAAFLSGPTGLQLNYPGLLYKVTWDDGSTNTYTYCQLKMSGGIITHNYVTSSCGKTYTQGSTSNNNQFQVNFFTNNPFGASCSTTSTYTTYQAVLAPPTNSFTGPNYVCLGQAATYTNTSYPGQTTSTTSANCINTSATYTWYVNNAPILISVPSSTKFTYTFPDHGNYTVSVQLDNPPSASCAPVPSSLPVCVQRAPVANFTVPTNTYCAPASVQFTDNSNIDAICNAAYTYLYTITYPDGTTRTFNSASPLVTLADPGDYTVTLKVTPPGGATSCPSTSAPQHIYVNGQPAPLLSADYAICGNNKTLNFDPTAGSPTKTTFPGTFQNGVYSWVVTAPAGAIAATFVNGTTSSSQYPVINFPDYGTYVVTVTQSNGCGGSASASQNIILQNSASITATVPATICPNITTFAVSSVFSDPPLANGTPKWITSGTGSFANDQSYNTTYTPSAADLRAGSIMLTITQTTTLSGLCQNVADAHTVILFPVNNITSVNTKSICDNVNLNYTITSSAPNSSYTWVANSTDVSGFAPSGSGSSINDILNLTSPTVAGTVTYQITPHANGCDGDPFTLTVTVTPKPTIGAAGPSGPICSNSPANIALTSNLTTANYIWTVNADPGIIGFTQPATPQNVTQIADALRNTGIVDANITYTITAYNGACSSTSTQVSITVHPQINITTSISQTVLCSGNVVNLTVNSNLANTNFSWSATTSNSSTVSGFAASGTGSGPTLQITDVPANNGTAPENIVYTINTSANGCAGPTVTKTIIVAPVINLTVTPASAIICSNSLIGITMSSNIPGTTYTWQAQVSAGANINGATNPTTPSSTSAIPDVLINSGSTTATVTYTITAYANGCTTTSNPIVVTVQPAITVNVNAPTNICSNQTSSIQLSSTVTGITYTWTVVTNGTVTGATNNSTGVTSGPNDQLINNGTAVGTVTYTITAHANNCANQLTPIVITVAPTPAISATPTTASICSGQPSNIFLTSNISTTKYTWSVIVTGNITGAVAQTTPITLTSPSQIQQILTNKGSTPGTVTYTISAINSATASNCPSNTATVTITVQPAPVTANAGPDANLCGITFYQLQGNSLGPNGSGVWTLTSGQTGVIFNDPTNPTATVSGLVPGQSYTFRYTSKGRAPCNDNFDDVTINDQIAIITADFALVKTSNCDPVTVNFTNNSTPATGLTYAWDFGNGTTSTLKTPPAVTYTAQANGKDSTYTIKLTITNACSTDTKTVTFTVKAARPIVAINPNKTLTCAPFNLVLQNLSPGTNISYTYYLTNASGATINTVVKTDKSDQVFAIPDPGTYKVYMVAQSECGTAQTATYTIVLTPTTALPRLTVNGNEGTGCAPLTVTFHNNSTGTTSYRYEWGDGTSSLITANSNDVTHTFLKGGTYTVKLFASNGCTIDAPATPITINVLYQPTPSFSSDNTMGCKNLTVQFKNTTTDPASSQLTDLKYDWDFGDGSAHSSAINPSHNYTYKNSPYTVTLTATNLSGCSNVVTQANFITVNGSSLTDFVAKPDSVISIPDYKFNFTDLTTNNPRTWKWDFGDGSSSTQQNPSHTYADTGLYKVTLTSANAFCDSTKSHYVRIIGVPGQVYIPNAFMPNSVTPSLRTFILKGSGLKTWSFQIYNNYGQMVFQSNKLNEKGEPTEAWDGTFNGVQVQQGTYVWQASGTFINGNEWKGMSYNGSPPKHTGIIYLIK